MNKLIVSIIMVIGFSNVLVKADETPTSITGYISKMQVRGQYFVNNDAQTNLTIGNQVFAIYANDSKYSALLATALTAKGAVLSVTIEYTKSSCNPGTPDTWCRIQDIILN